MTTVPTARDALMGNPPSAGHEPRKSDLVAVLEQMQTVAAVEMLKAFHGATGDLPGSGNEAGDKRAVLATAADGGGVYSWDGSEWQLVAALPVVLTESLSAQEAAASAEAAAASETAAGQSASTAASSANLAGVVLITRTKAEADAALAGLSEGDVVEVAIDETREDAVTRYRVESGALEFLVEFTREPDTDDVLNASDVPGVSLTQALDAAVNRANHTGTQGPDVVELPGPGILQRTTAGAGPTAYAAVLPLDKRGAELEGGYTIDAPDDGVQDSGTYTPDPEDGNLRRLTNGGAFTLAAPTAAGDYTMILHLTNNASAGAVTLTGFDRTDGDDLTTTDAHKFLLNITKLAGSLALNVVALQ